jgi:hypothetical protein
MKFKGYIHFRKWFLFPLMSLFFIFMASGSVKGQPHPPRPINVTVNQNLSFGAFTHGASGGSVIIDSNGSRSSTLSVILLNFGIGYAQAIYRINGPAGTVISLLNGPDAFLPGSNGGTLRLHIGNSNPASPFVTTAGSTLINVGGTLTVGDSGANPPGSYSGSFNITFIQE